MYQDGGRYHSLATNWKKRFGMRVSKIMLLSGCSCPNRDETLKTGGCIFCSMGGSGEFAGDENAKQLPFYTMTPEDILAQISSQKGLRGEEQVVAYFQAYTNTYGPQSYLEPLFLAAIEHESVCALSIATRPDCLRDEMIAFLKRLNEKKPVMVELGLQTMHDTTAKKIGRGYDLAVFETAVKKLRAAGLEVIVHTILGLPDETEEMMLATMRYLSLCDIQGIKIQLLHVLAGTKLEQMYRAGEYEPLTKEVYVSLVAKSLAVLRKDIVIHRLTGDGRQDELLAPLWSVEKKSVLNEIRHYMKEHQIVQGMRVGV